jgi:type I restriction enzyme S subunit
MELKKGYKQTELGLIPEDWELKLINNVVKVSTGSKNTQDKISDGKYPFYVRSQTIERINSYSYNCEAVLTVGDGVGTGKVFHYVNHKFELHQRVYIMNEFVNGLDGYYFYLFFSNNFYARVMQMTAKSSVDSVRREMIAGMKISIPPLPEQKSIAQVLVDTDNLLQSIKEKITKKRAIKQGAMQQLLTPKEDWVVKKLGNISEFRNGKPYEHHITPNGNYELISLNSIDINGYLKKTHHKLNANDSSLMKNDLVMILSDVAHGNFLGLTDVISENDKYVLNYRVGGIRLNNAVYPYFARYFINSNQDTFKKLGQGSSQLNLTKNEVLNFVLKYPSLLEQKKIATILSDMDEEIAQLEQKLSKYKMLKQGLMQNLLTGKIRLV